MIRICLLSLFVLGVGLSLDAQSFSKSLLYQNDHSFDVNHQQHFIDSSKYVVYLPSLYYGVSQQGPTITDYLSRDSAGRLLIDPSAALPFAEEQNILQFGGRANGLGFGIKINQNVSIAASYGMQYVSHVDYPLQALDFYTAGNAFIFGEQLDLSFKMTNQAFHAYTLSANLKSSSLTIGGAISLLSGVADASVERDRLMIEAKPLFYDIITDTDFRINTTDLIRYEDLQNIFVDYTGDFGDSFFSNNRGVSLSLFAQYAIDEQTNFIIKVSDWGSISWKSSPINYSSTGTNSFGGVSILDILDPNKTVSYQDSLEQLLDIIESNNSYSTSLPLSIGLAGYHQYNASLLFSGAVHYTSFSGFKNYAVGAAAQYNVLPSVSLSTSLNYSTLNPINIGLGANLSFGAVDLFAHTSNILSIANQIQSPYTYSSIGINLHFGKFRKDLLSDKL